MLHWIKYEELYIVHMDFIYKVYINHIVYSI